MLSLLKILDLLLRMCYDLRAFEPDFYSAAKGRIKKQIMIIKEFCEEDKDTFIQLCKEFYSSKATLRGYDDKITNTTFCRIMDKHENLWGFLFLDSQSHKAIGYSLITSYWCNEEGGNVLVLDELYIAPSCRHKGYASKFMEWLIRTYKNRAVSITLEVLTSNHTAQSLYSKEGFTPDGFTTYTKRIS